MSLTWTPRSGHPSGCHLPGFEAEVRRKGETTSVLVIPTAGRWIALGPVGIIEAPTPAGWPSEEAARAAVEEAVVAFLAPKRRGRAARATRPVKAALTDDGIARLDAYRATLPLYEGKTCPRSRALESLVMALSPTTKEIP